MKDSAILIDGLTLAIDGRRLLEEASLEGADGEFVLLVGLSGTGKTVLLKLISGLLRTGERGFDVEGSMRIFSRQILSQRGPVEEVGLVVDRDHDGESGVAHRIVGVGMRMNAGV